LDTSSGDPFLKIGVTIDTLRRDGKIPVLNERFIMLPRGVEISNLRSFKILMGILLGPLAFFIRKDEMQFIIS
jgi:hypothetical protein